MGGVITDKCQRAEMARVWEAEHVIEYTIYIYLISLRTGVG